ncbi:MAG TPA: hypothetical protein PKE29_00935 [Phycisphaerales bacterium]|nr:hypothetical protein [Phycisphaerales bacterium]
MNRRMCASLMLGAAAGRALALGGCQPPRTRATAPVVRGHAEPLPNIQLLPTTDPPAWWSDGPVREGTTVSVCGVGDGETLLAARRKALEGAMRAFVAAAGSLPREPGVRADCAITDDGLYRAFVRVTAAVP